MLGRHVWSQARRGQAQHLLNLLCGVVFATSEYIRFGALAVANLVNGNVCAVSDQPNESISRKQGQAHDQSLLESGQAVFLLTSIHDIDEDGRGGSGSRETVLDGGVHAVHFLRDVLG